MGEINILSSDRKIIDEVVAVVITDTKKEIALKMKADGVSSDFIFKYFGIWV